ncbi:RNA polymerase sigma factor [Thalassoglobus neptunius]|uniref:RNA polymerase sigma factor n=1 Tax=Thalassoglobus neptunius TaxID=1938619 RepID=UPI0018D22A02|nr:sigma-70 family RNA polymerase sigma factor [Thalassoglobus neptunius]
MVQRLTTVGLIAGIQARKNDAWIRMTTLFGPLVHKWIHRTGLQSADVADISQEVFQAAVESIDRYKHSPEKHGSFTGWLFGITRNKIRDFFNQTKNEPLKVDSRILENCWDPKSIVEDEVPESSIQNAVVGRAHSAAKRIRGNCELHVWQSFWRVVVNGESAVAVSKDLELTPEAVRQACHRTVRRIQDELSKLEKEFETPDTFADALD